ncbi:MAG: IclR family transcriptional regulator [Variovorax sp.]|jgi:DNA-binding IclR family transcriptional regulator|nr:MAG: IclR family transcriptional regulator [Variovorax sp.]
MKQTAKEDPGVASVNRALSMLLAFRDSVDGMSLAELCEATGLYHSTALRLCESLEHFRFVKRMADGRYRLGPMPFQLGTVYQNSFRLGDYALPILRELVGATREVAAIYVREGDERICVHRLEHPRSVRMHVREGDAFALATGAAGRVLLAFSDAPGEAFDAVRAAHYAVSQGERDAESAAIACPVFGIDQKLVCAISLGLPRFRFDAEAFAASLPHVMAAGARLTSDLGGDPAPFAPPFARLKGLQLPRAARRRD